MAAIGVKGLIPGFYAATLIIALIADSVCIELTPCQYWGTVAGYCGIEVLKVN